MKILHVYSDARKSDQKETWTAFKSIEQTFPVEHVHALKNSDYPNAIKENWGKGEDLIIVEQDIVPTPKHIKDLMSCKCRLCSFPYLVKADQPNSYSIFDFASHSKPDNWMTFDGARYIDRVGVKEHPDYCGLSGFGLTKIGARAQELLNFPKLYKLNRWDIIDSWLSLRYYEKIKRNRIFHVHYPPVKHNHFSEARKPKENKLLVF